MSVPGHANLALLHVARSSALQVFVSAIPHRWIFTDLWRGGQSLHSGLKLPAPSLSFSNLGEVTGPLSQLLKDREIWELDAKPYLAQNWLSLNIYTVEISKC